MTKGFILLIVIFILLIAGIIISSESQAGSKIEGGVELSNGYNG